MSNTPTPPTVPASVHEGLLAVRESGLTNMFDARRVADIALNFGYPDAADWVTEDTVRYAQWVFGRCAVVLDNPAASE